jgi:hypothetical protein
MATSAEPDLDLSGLDPAFDGVLRRSEGRCEYFQDRNKRWPFHCDEGGYRLLARLLRAATPVVAAVQAKIEATCGSSSADVVAEGQRIYARKPNMGEHDVTWSQIEYAHLGLQKEYIRYKSVQRLTEAWACLQRARRAGVFDALDDTAPSPPPRLPLRVASLGGGPGFELLAVRWFFERHYPRYDLDLVSLDLEESWRSAAEGLGIRFQTWDVRDGDGLERAAGGPIDYALASYVLKMYMANETCARWMGGKLNDPSDPLAAVLVVSRDENLDAATRVMRDVGGIDVWPLMESALEPGGHRDDRQLAYVPREKKRTGGSGAAPHEPLTFPNVPYEEHKKKRGSGSHHGYQHGGPRGGRFKDGGGARDGGWFKDGGSRGGGQWGNRRGGGGGGGGERDRGSRW